MKCRVIVNRKVVAENKREGTNKPCISIRTYKGVEYARRVRLFGDDWILEQNFENPLCSGATVYAVGQREKLEIVG